MHLIKNYHHWILRLYLVYVFVPIGYSKLGSSVANLGNIGYLVGPFEFFGALFLLIGPFANSILDFIITDDIRGDKYKMINKILINDMVSRIGSLMISIIMIGAIYMHIFKWNDTIFDVKWQILLLVISLYLLIKDCPYLLKNNE